MSRSVRFNWSGWSSTGLNLTSSVGNDLALDWTVLCRTGLHGTGVGIDQDVLGSDWTGGGGRIYWTGLNESKLNINETAVNWTRKWIN